VNGLAQAAVPAIARPALDNKRVAAAAIDLFVVFFVGVLLGLLAGGYTSGARAITIAWALYYYFAFEALTGQTLGKKVMGLRVANVDGSPPEMRQIAIRSVLRLIDGVGVYLVGLIAMLASGDRRQRLGDMAAKTIVTSVEVKRRAGGGDDLPSEVPVVPFHPPEPEPTPAPKPDLPPAAVEKPSFEPYRVPDPPPAAAPAPPVQKAPPPPPPVQKAPLPPVQTPPAAPATKPPASPVQVAPAPKPYTPPADEPRIELVPDPPVEGDEDEKPRIKIVSPMDVVMGEDEPEQDPQGPPPQRSA
jgi:uncharacterized RDD family membrane protein YckC